jgi:hypothetical protein
MLADKMYEGIAVLHLVSAFSQAEWLCFDLILDNQLTHFHM